MLTGKQRSFLRSMANSMEPIFQIGKSGIEDNFLKMVDDALEARELLKIKILSSSGYEAREASDIICERLKCEGIQSIGSKIVIYRRSTKKPKIEIPQ